MTAEAREHDALRSARASHAVQRIVTLARRVFAASDVRVADGHLDRPAGRDGEGPSTDPNDKAVGFDGGRLVAPIRLADGSIAGSLEVRGESGQAWTERDAAILDDLAACVGREWDLLAPVTPRARAGALPAQAEALAHDVAHDPADLVTPDLREPLQALFGFMEVLKRETRPTVIAAHARMIASAVEALLAIVDRTSEPVAGAPDAPLAPTLPAPVDARPEACDGGARILLADDLDLNRKLICDMLAIEGHSVDGVADGAAALKAAAAGGYDLILMDMIMPGMDGLAATRAIRALPEPACDVPIVALTAHSFREQLDSCLAAGMDATLTKPMSLDALTTAVAFWTRGRKRAA